MHVAKAFAICGYGPGLRRGGTAIEARAVTASLRVNLRIRIAQNVLLHLAHRIARQVVDDEHALGHLEFGEPPIETLHHGSFRNVSALVADHDRGDALAEIGMGYADHGGFDHAGHGVDLAFDFLRIDVEATGDHQILAAADDVDIALVVDL